MASKVEGTTCNIGLAPRHITQSCRAARAASSAINNQLLSILDIPVVILNQSSVSGEDAAGDIKIFGFTGKIDLGPSVTSGLFVDDETFAIVTFGHNRIVTQGSCAPGLQTHSDNPWQGGFWYSPKLSGSPKGFWVVLTSNISLSSVLVMETCFFHIFER